MIKGVEKWLLKNVNDMTSIKLIKILLVMNLFFPLVTAEDEYLNEFNESNEQATLDSSWYFLTSDGVQRQINVYKYCKNEECILVLFDTLNRGILNDVQSHSFLSNYKMKERVNNGQITESLYDISFKKSFTCNLAAPRFGKEAENLVIQVASEDILPEILPKNARVIVQSVYKAGKEMGFVKSPNVIILLVGALCYGGDYTENAAYSVLTSCKSYIKNVKNEHGYEGQVEDMVSCHKDAISKLEIAKNSPDVLLQHVETGTGNLIKSFSSDVQSIKCKFKNIVGESCEVSAPQFDQSAHDNILNQIQTLKNSYPDTGDITSWSQTMSSKSSERLSNKNKEAWDTINSLVFNIEKSKIKLTEYKKFDGIYLSLINFIWTPRYDFSVAENNFNLASQKLFEAYSLYSVHKYNSAKNIANEGMQSATLSFENIINEEMKERSFSREFIIVVIVIVVLLIFHFKE